MTKFIKAPFAIVALFALAGLLYAQTKPGKPTFSLTLSAPKTEVALGAKIFIEIRQTNISEENIDCSRYAGNGVDYKFEYDVRDQHGAVAAKVLRSDPFAGGFRTGSLLPGKSITSGVLLNRLYQFDQPGEYTIQVSGRDSGNPGAGFVKSNIITVTVLPEGVQPPAKQQNSSPTAVLPESEQPAPIPRPPDAKPSPARPVLLPQVAEKPKPRFSLAIEEDKNAARLNPGLHRLVVKYTNVWEGDEIDMFYKEAEGMYNMSVVRDGIRVAETPAMWELRRYRKADNDNVLKNPRVLRLGQSWTDPLDVSDYYDMTQSGTYEITVTRESLPLDPANSVLVKSNTISIVVPQGAAAPNAPGAEKPKPKFALAISLVNPDEGLPGVIRVERENISDTAIREAKCWTLIGMYNFIISRNGEPLEASGDGARRLQSMRTATVCPGNETLIEINPGEADVEESVPLSYLFDVDKPGYYEVYVTRETDPWNPAKSVLVASNTLYFVVPEPPPAEATPLDAGAGVQ
jgi:hypothetical protein